MWEIWDIGIAVRAEIRDRRQKTKLEEASRGGRRKKRTKKKRKKEEEEYILGKVGKICIIPTLGG